MEAKGCIGAREGGTRGGTRLRGSRIGGGGLQHILTPFQDLVAVQGTAHICASNLVGVVPDSPTGKAEALYGLRGKIPP